MILALFCVCNFTSSAYHIDAKGTFTGWAIRNEWVGRVGDWGAVAHPVYMLKKALCWKLHDFGCRSVFCACEYDALHDIACQSAFARVKYRTLTDFARRVALRARGEQCGKLHDFACQRVFARANMMRITILRVKVLLRVQNIERFTILRVICAGAMLTISVPFQLYYMCSRS